MKNPTSHFIGISIDSSLFSEIFSSVKILLGKDSGCIEFQTVSTLHVTLYYLSDVILSADILFLQKYFSQISISNILQVENFDYFYKDGNSHIAYFRPIISIDVYAIHGDFAEHFGNMENIYENTMPFIPHITFFRIIDGVCFAKYKYSIESYIKAFLKKNKNFYTTGIHLYAVDSHVHPEKQIILF